MGVISVELIASPSDDVRALIAELGEVKQAVRLLIERARVVAEGAGAVPVAAALAGRGGSGRVQ